MNKFWLTIMTDSSLEGRLRSFIESEGKSLLVLRFMVYGE